jgi:hypothetical protein
LAEITPRKTTRVQNTKTIRVQNHTARKQCYERLIPSTNASKVPGHFAGLRSFFAAFVARRGEQIEPDFAGSGEQRDNGTA